MYGYAHVLLTLAYDRQCSFQTYEFCVPLFLPLMRDNLYRDCPQYTLSEIYVATCVPPPDERHDRSCMQLQPLRGNSPPTHCIAGDVSFHHRVLHHKRDKVAAPLCTRMQKHIIPGILLYQAKPLLRLHPSYDIGRKPWNEASMVILRG